jgi:Tfp pilus assembly protein PilE
MLKLRVKSFWKALCRDARGITFVEIVVTLIVAGLLVGSIPPALAAIVRAQTSTQERRIGEVLTRSEFEYIKSQPYRWGNTSHPYYDRVPALTEDYRVTVDAQPVYPDTYKPILLVDDPVGDLGIQQITITVYGYHLLSEDPQDLKPLMTTINYKLCRTEE